MAEGGRKRMIKYRMIRGSGTEQVGVLIYCKSFRHMGVKGTIVHLGLHGKNLHVTRPK